MPPLGRNFLIFLQFLGKNGQIVGWCNLRGLPPTLGEIRNPPLLATRRSVGVASEMNPRNPCRCQSTTCEESTLSLNSRAEVIRSLRTGVSVPTRKGALSSKNYKNPKILNENPEVLSADSQITAVAYLTALLPEGTIFTLNVIRVALRHRCDCFQLFRCESKHISVAFLFVYISHSVCVRIVSRSLAVVRCTSCSV